MCRASLVSRAFWSEHHYMFDCCESVTINCYMQSNITDFGQPGGQEPMT